LLEPLDPFEDPDDPEWETPLELLTALPLDAPESELLKLTESEPLPDLLADWESLTDSE
jgi:hypothetical protein